MNRLRELRKERGMTQKQVADTIGVQRTTYLKYESGDILMATHVLSALADLFDVSVDYLIGNSELRKNIISADELDEDVFAIRELLRHRPEMRTLLSAARNASTDIVLETASIIEVLKESRNNGII